MYRHRHGHNHRHHHRNNRGQALVEFALATALALPVALLGVDVFLILLGLQLNQSTCAQAARSASCGDPRLTYIRASQVVSKAALHYGSTFSFTLMTATNTVRPSQLDAMVPFGGAVLGTVDVTTAVDITPVMLGWFLGKEKRLHMETSEELPTTYVVANVLEKAAHEQ